MVKLTWGEFKKAVEAGSVRDDDEMAIIDVNATPTKKRDSLVVTVISGVDENAPRKIYIG